MENRSVKIIAPGNFHAALFEIHRFMVYTFAFRDVLSRLGLGPLRTFDKMRATPFGPADFVQAL
jgi:hypothetical protein